MRKLTLAICLLLTTGAAFTQVPQALNYQAIARNSTGQIVPSQNIGVRFTITDATGNTVFYQETHTTTTNAFGLFTLAIGKGTAVSGTIPAIDWATGGDKMLRVEIAPQGGTNYTMQGTTQLLSVPYSLYSEKTRLIAGNAITITGGNTINANYTAGPGINITGNVISTTGGNAWFVNGNAGTTAANFVGTTDNTRLNFRTDNQVRMYFETSYTAAAGYNVGRVFFSDATRVNTNPAQVVIYGKDIVGHTAPVNIGLSTVGQTWGNAVGNTLGRFIRFSQFNTTSVDESHFYDLGISQDSSFFLSQHLQQNGGPIPPRKMITISNQDRVGINLDLNEKPTADFHTKGTARFQNISANNTFTRVMVMDANGNVAARDAATLSGGGNFWSLTGNAATTAANFVGTTDNTRLNFRTDNQVRMYFETSYTAAAGYNVGRVFFSDATRVNTNPANVVIYGKDIVGHTAPVSIALSTVGQTWGNAVGNTFGRFIRFSQLNTTSIDESHFYDLGISQDSSFFLSQHLQQNGGPIPPRKMITISNQDRVGINLDLNEKPTADFHTKGTARFQNISANNTFTRVMVMDANGNVAARDAATLSGGGNFWSLTGNAATTAANFLGTIDNQPLRIRVNNANRVTLQIPSVTPAGTVGTTSFSDFATIASNPAQIAVYGRDIPGESMNMHLYSSVQGMTWAPSGGGTNTMGRHFRLSQYTTADVALGEFFDFGMDQGKSFFISEHGIQNEGPTFFKKMITISPNDFVGINFNWGENPTANFHTKGTARFEGIAANNALTRVMVMDVNGNVAARDAATLAGGANWSLTGNAGTTAANFLGTTDNQRLNFRTTNLTRMYIDGTYSGFGQDVSAVYISDEAALGANRPGQLGIFGRDVAGLSLPLLAVSSVAGATWGAGGGQTSGRVMRLSQMNTGNFTQSHFYDIGIGQDSSLYISNHNFQNVGGVLPRQMIEITAQDRVGINMDWQEKPTATFHTKGTVRLQNLPTGTGNILVVDANGNVFRASQTASRTTNNDAAIQSLQNELDKAKKEIAELKLLISEIQKSIKPTTPKAY